MSKEETYLNNWKRAQADFENYKKQEKERISEACQKEKEKTILVFLPLIDSLDLLWKTLIPEDLKNDSTRVLGIKLNLKIANIVDGIIQIRSLAASTLRALGVKQIQVKPGDKFDVNTMEAI